LPRTSLSDAITIENIQCNYAMVGWPPSDVEGA